ncbi:MAG: preprotein translocase subunit YajC [Candidatus Faecalibacterium intestinavium]|uniref:Preprotein translocase subunit YajC n=1 Tax=Candidatus Faecalibacterium intestinavium TaxID=2838580 RepID=A0A9E2KLP7_9FIRM|nr:preprotein translocase subunit YajC [Candidatus Faecalibacterium intestinavium]
MAINWEVIIWTCVTLAVLMGIIGLILYAISARNVRAKRKELGEVHTDMKVGSRIMFAGGIYGKVVGMDDEETLRVEVAPKVVVTISRYAVQTLLK